MLGFKEEVIGISRIIGLNSSIMKEATMRMPKVEAIGNLINISKVIIRIIIGAIIIKASRRIKAREEANNSNSCSRTRRARMASNNGEEAAEAIRRDSSSQVEGLEVISWQTSRAWITQTEEELQANK